ncbi:Protein of unknown function [Bacillus cereus]|nr:Protein of unknown function [Bacillus wiedmannii]SCC55770.1 Protein of unknown function [Bacillus thuringiensis]SCC57061.1 Protein of unknown function [Bacillus cereus]SCC52048.1 Protein of unknown function [Bacillus wiedmannii]SCM03685.1 Protein of unknown function [Bacillus wiedmannii]
MENDEFW